MASTLNVGLVYHIPDSYITFETLTICKARTLHVWSLSCSSWSCWPAFQHNMSFLVYVHLYLYTYIYIYIHINKYIHIHVYICIYVDISTILTLHVWHLLYMQGARRRAPSSCSSWSCRPAFRHNMSFWVCVHPYIYTYIHIHIYTYIQI